MPNPLHKVTCFIVRPGPDLVLFRHPTSGIQIPGGTVEDDEQPEAAALREAEEESGLIGQIRLVNHLTDSPYHPTAGMAWILAATPVYSQPDASSFDWARLRKGIQVQVLRHSGAFTHISYQEHNRLPDPEYLTYVITGWVPNDALTDVMLRHFYLLETRAPTAASWQTQTDHHTFTLFWAPINALPAIIPPQDEWLHFLPDTL